ncbi:hypothetical protein [Actinomadura alba]|uniref:Uncharacterized protein n=1 Tax=Actinomadura alba TaxID=406431 RepID=A0ABR7LJX8_9ACTN|nr:hypothetical protein [Actinomadura alba]MBC6465071.1 hypothetical protein [Actinomadura alba]
MSVVGLKPARTWRVRMFAAGSALALLVLSLLVVADPGHAAEPPGWTVVHRTPVTPLTDLVDIVATGPGDAWAVGQESAPEGGVRTLVLHWTGGSWVRHPSPPTLTQLRAAAASSPNNLWVLGNTDEGTVLTFRWDGTRWTDGAKLPGDVHATGVATAGPGSAHVSGYRYDDAVEAHRPALLRWNGAGWVDAPLPVLAPGTLEGVSVSADPDGPIARPGFWAVGTERVPGERSRTLALRYDGTSWHRVPTPEVAEKADQSAVLIDVAPSGTGEAWAVGVFQAPEASNGILLHWDGAEWSLKPAKESVTDFRDVTPDGSGGAWAMNESEIWHFANGTWTPSPLPLPALLHGIAWIPGTQSTWSAGSHSSRSGAEGVIMLAGDLPLRR